MIDDELASFWTHLEEFKGTLLKMLIVVGVGFLVALYFYTPLFSFLSSSYSKKLEGALIKEVIHDERVTNTSSQPIVYQLPTQAYIEELPAEVIQIGSSQYQIAAGHQLNYKVLTRDQPLLLILSPLEGLNLVLKVCFWMGLAFTSPLWIYFLIQFILPGLKKREKQLILPFIVFSLLCISAGVAFAYGFSIPLANAYLENFNATIGKNVWSLTHYIDYTLILFLGHAVAFELCLFLFLLVHFQILSVDWLIGKRKHMIVMAFIVGAVLTPPDVLTQLTLAVPLLGIYELTILYGKLRKLREIRKPLRSISTSS